MAMEVIQAHFLHYFLFHNYIIFEGQTIKRKNMLHQLM